MKTKTLTLLASAACLASLITLTACGNSLKDVDFESYNNEITSAQFYEKINSLEDKSDFKGYTKYRYEAQSGKYSGDKDETSVDIEESTNKVDVENKKIYATYNYSSEAKDAYGIESEEEKNEYQYQQNGNNIIRIDLNTKSYTNYYFNYDEVIRFTNYIEYSDAADYADEANDSEITFYCDDEIYTAVISITRTNEESEDNYKMTYSKDIKAIFQFYYKDNKFVFKSQVDETSETKVVKNENTTEIKYEGKSIEIIEYDFTVPSIDTLDLSKYTEDLTYYTYQ